MAHFAKINEDGIVEQVIVIANDDCGGGDFPDSEPIGQTFIASLGFDGNWKQTSYNNSFRHAYAGIGYIYDSVKDAFYSPSPYPSWVLDENFIWEPPVPMPETGGPWQWNEEEQQWEELS